MRKMPKLKDNPSQQTKQKKRDKKGFFFAYLGLNFGAQTTANDSGSMR